MKIPDIPPTALARALPKSLRSSAEIAVDHIQHGTFQRSMSLLVAATSIVTGAEVAYEHYKGSYSNPVMYSPVILSGVLTSAGLCGFFSRRLATTFLRYTSFITLIDGVIGFGFHIRGIARKPGGWRLPLTNIVMGPPLFAPLLFSTSAYLGVIASYLQREEDHGIRSRTVDVSLSFRSSSFGDDIRIGRFQKHLCVVCAIGTFAVGAESWYSHYKNNFKYRVQWSPVLLVPVMIFAALSSISSKRLANTLLPAASSLLMLNGAVGTYYHARGIVRRSGGMKKPLYNILYGPPIFAPMLMAACGMLGMLAYLMRRER
ncbi:hypothetical protein [Acidicapsa ligni]|uniref:hypothetical protein n=1 Tax=Acidicapsa ligni TaxID=542300 RepID=UPI0021E02853|nr:hypothetical protein [Acidicapsa ligni]